MKHHHEIVIALQEEMKKRFASTSSSLVALQYGKGYSNTTRTKSYKKNCLTLNCGPLNRVLKINHEQQTVIVEPRLTMEELVKALSPYKITVPVIPEFKGITVGGAIMGAAAESSSHLYGTFNDCCVSYEILLGNGEVVTATAKQNPDLFYSIPASYGSLGALLSAELRVIPFKDYVAIKCHILKPSEAVHKIRELTLNSSAEYIDGVVLSPEKAVIIEGRHVTHDEGRELPLFSPQKFYSKWFIDILSQETSDFKMAFEEYLFRYDRGAFWMGGYLFHSKLLLKLFLEGIWKIKAVSQNYFNQPEVEEFQHHFPSPLLKRALFDSFMSSQKLWSILHKAEQWVQNRFVIQDFCIPESKAHQFLLDTINQAAIFPLWLCPIKKAHQKQLFAPHLIKNSNEEQIINIGVYGVPGYSQDILTLTRYLEHQTFLYGGRKVLYSRSYYTEEEFWEIYSKPDYEKLRQETYACNTWHDITHKVLSE